MARICLEFAFLSIAATGGGKKKKKMLFLKDGCLVKLFGE